MNPHTPTDDELWSRARDGDEQAFGALFDRHARTVYNYCFRRTASWSEAQDVTSVVFLETWRQRARVQPQSGSLLPWLYGVATNVLHNHRRSMRRHRDALSRMPKPVPHPDDMDEVTARLDAERRMRRVLDAVQRLPRRDREVLVLSVWEELDHNQIAEALGIAAGTVRSRLSRARARLRDLSDHPASGPATTGVGGAASGRGAAVRHSVNVRLPGESR
ncbi:RNA polymerase sigma factor [Actinomadura harenae]|uniref:Sigma-70 family RNA polymerase sigma factor n=1 Tax=Actinomadura harenae TaxID=2483351 RepID=A0A3M2LYK9_9ACTN|nr:sigma-70 family RNA polymerase sigma factor [Actinomadura harenae]RMI42020.1 sigma-70 family RNA polymerase sigma factor [Actinomadura harenae]